MDQVLLPLTEDRYGSFSAAEHAEYELMRGGLHGSELDILTTFDFDSFASSLQTEHCNALEPKEVSAGIKLYVVIPHPFHRLLSSQIASSTMQAAGQNEGNSSAGSTPSTSTRSLDTPTLTPDGPHLVLAETTSHSPHIGSPYAFDLSSLSNMVISSPAELGKDNFGFHPSGGNALGLVGGNALNEAMHFPSQLVSSGLNETSGACGGLSIYSGLSSNGSLTLVSHADVVTSDRHELHLPFQQSAEPDYSASLVPRLDDVTVAAGASDGSVMTSSLSPTVVINHESDAPSPLTSQAVELRPPHHYASNRNSGKAHSTRAADANVRLPRVYNTRRVATRSISSRAVSATQRATISSVPSTDSCEYGWRVWVLEGGNMVAKWKCAFCGQLVGRRPDLNRHYKTCVLKDKFFCEDITRE